MTQDYDPKKLKITFAPGVLEQLEQEMDAEELQAFLDELQQKVENGTLFEESRPVDLDKLREEDPAEYDLLMAQMERQEEQEKKPFYLN